MGAPALAATLPLARRGRCHASVTCDLAFHQPPGPVVAVCALVGGSSASTLALALARQAARESSAPVLVSESASDRAGLAVLAAQATALSLPQLAAHIHSGQPPPRPFEEPEPRLRLVAATPRRDGDVDADAMRELLKHARDAHGLVIVDCGTAWPAATAILDQATHIVWTLTASPPAIARATSLWEAGIAPAPGLRREALVASVTDRRQTTSVRALRRLAAERCERLVMAPFSAELARGEHDVEPLWRVLSALGAWLNPRRP
jgi:hypothetical protein